MEEESSTETTWTNGRKCAIRSDLEIRILMHPCATICNQDRTRDTLNTAPSTARSTVVHSFFGSVAVVELILGEVGDGTIYLERPRRLDTVLPVLCGAGIEVSGVGVRCYQRTGRDAPPNIKMDYAVALADLIHAGIQHIDLNVGVTLNAIQRWAHGNCGAKDAFHVSCQLD